jgi:hypothetical protein
MARALRFSTPSTTEVSHGLEARTPAAGSIAEAAEKIEKLIALEEMQRQRRQSAPQLPARPPLQFEEGLCPREGHPDRFARSSGQSGIGTANRRWRFNDLPAHHPVSFITRSPLAPDRDPAIRPAFAPAIAATIPEWLPWLLAVLGLGGAVAVEASKGRGAQTHGATSEEAAGVARKAKPRSDRLDDCRDQWEDDLAWCDRSFVGRTRAACHSWAGEEYQRCLDGIPRRPFRL